MGTYTNQYYLFLSLPINYQKIATEVKLPKTLPGSYQIVVFCLWGKRLSLGQ